jgi:hypothetical protein
MEDQFLYEGERVGREASANLEIQLGDSHSQSWRVNEA